MSLLTLNQNDSERKYAATICRNCIYLTRLLSENWPLSVFLVSNSTWKFDRRVKRGCSLVCKLRALIILKSFRSFNDITDRGKTKFLRSSVTNFSFNSVKLSLNLCNISLFPILSLTQNLVRESLLLSTSLLRMTDWTFLGKPSPLASNIYCRKFLDEDELQKSEYI